MRSGPLSSDEFIDDFEVRHGLRLDWVYEAKMMYALFDQVARGAFPRGTTIVALISGSGEVPDVWSSGLQPLQVPVS